MKNQKVVWFEGMKLNPHHFQQADLYNQYYINRRMSFNIPDNWGLYEIQIDSAALAGGTFNLIKCSGVMPDGLLFEMPDSSPLPKSRSFEEQFPATAEKLDVFLSIPIEKTAGINCELSESANTNSTRYTMHNTEVLDYNSGTSLRTLGIVKPNLQFKFNDESLEDFNYIKIGEITRSSDGKYKMNKNYIPPSISISHEMFSEYLRDILGVMVSKSRELRTQAAIQKPEVSITQVEILLMLQTINSFIPLVNYYYNNKHSHPENLYVLLLNLAGQLSTSSNLGIKTGEYPAYDHKHLTEIFKQLYDEINSMLNVQKTLTRRDIIIPLRKQSETLYVGQLSPNQLSHQFYVAVSGDIPEKKIISEFPRNIKISAYEEILAVHQAGIQGVPVEYIARPPMGIAVNEKAHYFRIIKEGRFWDKISQKNNIAFFMAAEFKGLQLELVLLTPGD